MTTHPATEPPRLADRAYEILRDRLVLLEIRPGDPINEAALAAELGLGRTPVREALKRLETDRLVESYPRRGTFATRTDLAELKSLTEMRILLEPVAAAKAAGSASPQQREQVARVAAEIQSLLESDPSPRTLIEYDIAAHRAIYGVLDNDYMRETLFRLTNLATRLWWSIIQQVPSVADHIEGHTALLRAVVDADVTRAEALARAHVTDFQRSLQAALVASATFTESRPLVRRE